MRLMTVVKANEGMGEAEKERERESGRTAYDLIK